MKAIGSLVWCIACAICVIVAPVSAQDKPEVADSPPSDKVYVKIATTLGDFILELDHEKAPKTVDNFLAYVDDGFYSGTLFHRIIKNFMIQGGGMTPDYTEKDTNSPIVNEADNGLKNVFGTVAMARLNNPHSATSQFFINVADNGFLNYRNKATAPGYCVFGSVIDGLDTIEAIRNTPVHKDSRADKTQLAAADTPVILNKATRVDPAEIKDIVKALRAKEAEAAQAKEAARMKNIEPAKSFIADRDVDTSGGTFTDSGLWILHVKNGTGDTPVLTDKVSVHYTGWLTSGIQFDSSVNRGKPSQFGLSGVIKGWTEGLGMMKVGGKSYLIIPPELAYGKQAKRSIPSDSTLIFEIDLLEIVK